MGAPRARAARAKGREGSTARRKSEEPTPEPADRPTTPPGPSGATPVPTPRFVSEAYFMDFKFEPGNYYLAGREQLDGQQVLRIEYYPKRMFNDSEEDQDKRQEEDDAGREERERRPQRNASADRERNASVRWNSGSSAR